jgi:hypothetical protein
VIHFEPSLHSNFWFTVPDLAFSEMDFLQRSGRYVSVKEDKVSSKLRAKEKRKAVIAQDEISMFFKPNKTPFQPMLFNEGSVASSTHAEDRRSASSDRLGLDHLRRHRQGSPSFNFPQKLSRDFGRTKPTSNILSTFIGRNPILSRSEYGPQSTCKISEKASTYISWSETEISRERIKINRTRASSTPESIRRSLEKTGIFRDTGINRAARRARVSPQAYEKPSRRDRTRITRSFATRTNYPEIIGRVVSAPRSGSDELTSSHGDHRQDTTEEAAKSKAKNDITQVRDREAKREMFIIEHFDPHLGWHERPRSSEHGQTVATTAKKGEFPDQPKSAPIDRLERAEMARIKRLSTAVPLTRPSLARDRVIIENPHDSSEQSNINLDQGSNQRTAPGDMVGAASQEKEEGLNFESSNQADVRTQGNDSGQSASLPSHNYKVIDQTVYHGAETGIWNAPFFLQTRHAQLDSEVGSALHEATDLLHGNRPSYMGCPTPRFSVGQGPLQNDYHNHGGRRSPQVAIEPYSIHQLQRHSTPFEPAHYEDHLRRIEFEQLGMVTGTETIAGLEDFQHSNIPEREGYFDPHADDCINSAFQHACEEMEDHGGYLETDSWNLRSPHVEMALEHYEVEELGDTYEEDPMMEVDQRQQLTMRECIPMGQGSSHEQYGLVRDSQKQAFWQPFLQY